MIFCILDCVKVIWKHCCCCLRTFPSHNLHLSIFIYLCMKAIQRINYFLLQSILILNIKIFENTLELVFRKNKKWKIKIHVIIYSMYFNHRRKNCIILCLMPLIIFLEKFIYIDCTFYFSCELMQIFLCICNENSNLYLRMI